MLIKGFSNFYLEAPVYRPGYVAWNAHFRLHADLSQLLPYVNAVLESAVYSEKGRHIFFSLDGFQCSLYHDRALARFFEDKDQALEFIFSLTDFLNDLHLRRETIKPSTRRARRLGVLDIYRMLPGTNCRECGFLTCMAFAAALGNSRAVPEQCPRMEGPLDERAVYPVYDEDGNLVSTVEIDINVSRRRRAIERLKRELKAMEMRLASMATGESGARVGVEIDGIRVRFTARELQVLRLLSGGYTNTQISRTLSISRHTVKSHVINIFNKLGVNDRTHAAVVATRRGLV